MSEVLTPGEVRLDVLERIWRGGLAATLDRKVKPAVEAAAELVRRAAEGDEAVYGVNTGFGKLASVKIPPEQTTALQRNLILSHCCGVGAPLDEGTTRLMMVLKLLSLGRGASGVQWRTIRLIEDMLAHGCHAGGARTGIGRRVGRPGAAGAHGGGDDRRRRGGS